MRSWGGATTVLVAFIAGVLGGVGGRWLASGALQRAIDELGDDVEQLRERVARRESWAGVQARRTGKQTEAELLAHVQAVALGQVPSQRSRRSSRLPGRLQSQHEAQVTPEEVPAADAGEGGSEE